jgi:hypothetical protein
MLFPVFVGNTAITLVGVASLILYAWLLPLPLSSQTIAPPYIQWQRSFGGDRYTNEFLGPLDGDDKLRDLVQTEDGGFLIVGESNSSPLDEAKTAPKIGGYDFWAIRLDSAGNKLWDRTYGGAFDDLPAGAIQVADGGFMLVGASGSGVSGTKTAPHYGDFDAWIVRLDAQGDQIWDKSFGGTQADGAVRIRLLADGGFIVGSYSWSPEGGNKTSGLFGMEDFWVTRLDSNGEKVWEYTFGGANLDEFRDIVETRDGGFLLCGSSASPPGGSKSAPYLGAAENLRDGWVVRLDKDGSKLWDKTYGWAGGTDFLNALLELPDGSFALAGSWMSKSKYWLLRLRADGEVLWEKKYGDAGLSSASALCETGVGALLLAGSAIGDDRNIPFALLDGVRNSLIPDSGDYDYWLVATDPGGNKQWDLALGGLRVDRLSACKVLQDGSLVVGGFSNADGNGVKTTPYTSGYDFWLLKLSAPAAAGPPALASMPQTSLQLRQSGYRLQLADGGSNCFYAIDQSFGMGPPWRAISTNRFAGVPIEVTDSGASNQIQRFYRARHLP